jgi:hypothetical protein
MKHQTLTTFTGPAVILLAFILGGCGDDGATPPNHGSVSSLTFTRADSSRVEFPATIETYVWCGDWETDVVPVPSVLVWIGTRSPGRTYVRLRAVVSDVEVGEPIQFPNFFIWDQPEGVSMFLFDPPNELATDTEDASGSIVFHQIPCPDGSMLDFSIDAVMGSEFWNMPPVAVRGRFTAEVTGPPPWGK